jgi:short-subunit dehydrogenase
MTIKGNEGQSALVTGASGGIGLELARVLAGNRFSLVLLARSRDKLEDLARELRAQHGTQVTIVPADLSEPGAAQAVFDSLNDAGVQIDLLVNNAGLLLEGRFDAIGLDEQLRLLQVNIVALTALTRLFLGPMLEHNRGRILNVASVAAFMPVPKLAVYAASKAYVLSFGDALFQELSGTKITVTTLCPGVSDTGMVHGRSLGGLPGMMIMDAKTVAQEGYRACVWRCGATVGAPPQGPPRLLPCKALISHAPQARHSWHVACASLTERSDLDRGVNHQEGGMHARHHDQSQGGSSARQIRKGARRGRRRCRGLAVRDRLLLARSRYATGYGSMNSWVADLVDQATADKVGKVWGLGSDTPKNPGPWEGEQRNMWKPTQQEAMWFHGGNLHQSRHYSHFLALQLKARLEGIPTPVYGLQQTHHKG